MLSGWCPAGRVRSLKRPGLGTAATVRVAANLVVRPPQRRIGRRSGDGLGGGRRVRHVLQPPPHLLTTLPAPAGGGRCVCQGVLRPHGRGEAGRQIVVGLRLRPRSSGDGGPADGGDGELLTTPRGFRAVSNRSPSAAAVDGSETARRECRPPRRRTARRVAGWTCRRHRGRGPRHRGDRGAR